MSGANPTGVTGAIKNNLPTVLQGIGTGLSVSGSLQKSAAYQQIGQQELIASQLNSQQLEQSANQAAATGEINAEEVNRQGNIAASRALAVAASSGGGASDPTIINMIARMAGQTHFNAMSALYQGKDQQRVMQNQAAIDTWSGQVANADAQNAADSAKTGAFTNALSGIGSMFSKFASKSAPGAA